MESEQSWLVQTGMMHLQEEMNVLLAHTEWTFVELIPEASITQWTHKWYQAAVEPE